jgi:hypothetical protein
MRKSLAAVLIVTATAVALPVGAHSEQHFDNIDTPHGGQMRMAGPYHLELVTKDKELVLYVTDHGDNNVPTEGGVGKATIRTGKSKEKTAIKLEPTGENTLKGTGEFTLTPETVVVVFVKLPDHEAQSVRFTPLKPKGKSTKKAQPAKSQSSDSDGHDHHHMHH